MSLVVPSLEILHPQFIFFDVGWILETRNKPVIKRVWFQYHYTKVYKDTFILRLFFMPRCLNILFQLFRLNVTTHSDELNLTGLSSLACSHCTRRQSPKYLWSALFLLLLLLRLRISGTLFILLKKRRACDTKSLSEMLMLQQCEVRRRAEQRSFWQMCIMKCSPDSSSTTVWFSGNTRNVHSGSATI